MEKPNLVELCKQANLLKAVDWLKMDYKDLMILDEARIWTVPIDHAHCCFVDGDETAPATLLLRTEEPTRHNTEDWDDEEGDEDEEGNEEKEREYQDEPKFGEYEIQPRGLAENPQDYSLRMATYGEHTDERCLPDLVCSIWYCGYNPKDPYSSGHIYHFEQDCPYGMEQFTTTIRDWFNVTIRPMCILKLLNENCADTLPYGLMTYGKDSICKLSTGVGAESVEAIWKWLGGTMSYYAPLDYFPVNVKFRLLKMPKEAVDKYRQWLDAYVDSKENYRT